MNWIEEKVATTTYFDKTFDCHAVKIGPGEYYFTNSDMVIITVLGSCVSACIRDTKTGIGGMNHFMLPASLDKDNPVSESMRYGSYAMEVLINQLIKHGARRQDMEAKIFGGGNVLSSFKKTNVGGKNADFVKKFLKDEQIQISAEDLNDIYPRKVLFFPKTGKVLVKKLKDLDSHSVVQRDETYAKQLLIKSVAGEIDLF